MKIFGDLKMILQLLTVIKFKLGVSQKYYN